MSLGIMLNPYKIQGIITIKAIIKGNKTIQQKDISWSKRILGKEALAHINMNTIIQVFIPKLTPQTAPLIRG